MVRLLAIPGRGMLVAATSVVPYTTPLLLLAFAGVLVFAWKRGQLARAFIAITVVLATLWGLALAAIWADYHDADGFTDCWPRCTDYQNAIAAAFWYGPVMFIPLSLLAGILGAITAHRGRFERARESSG
jgi:hypothetical protein